MKYFDGTDEELLEALTMGTVAVADPGVPERLGADVDLRSEWEALEEVLVAVESQADLCAADSAAAEAMESSPRELDVIARFRSHAKGADADSLPSTMARPHLSRRAWLTAACVLVLGLGGWSLSRTAPDLAGDGYLGSEAGMLVTEPAPPFGTARWNRPASADYVNVRVWEVRLADRHGPGSPPVPPAGEPLTQIVEWFDVEWSVEPEVLAGVKGRLFWEVTAMDLGKVEVMREGWLQSR